MILVEKEDPHYVFSECCMYLDEFVSKYRDIIEYAIKHKKHDSLVKKLYMNHVLNELSDYSIYAEYSDNSITLNVTDISTLYNSIEDEDGDVIVDKIICDDYGKLKFSIID